MGNVNRRTAIKRRNNKRNNDIKKMKKAFSSKVQKLGPGKKILNIDKEVVGQNGAIGLTLNEIISGREFATTLDNFNLVKVRSIQIVGFPNDNANNKPTYVNLDCFGDINTDNIGQSERTKIIYNDTKRPVYFNFRLPGIMKNAQKINSWIPREFFLDIMNLLSLKVMTSDSNEEVRLRVVIRCEFRVPRITAASTKIEVRHTGTDINKMCEVQYQKRFQREDLEKIFVKKEKTPKLKKEEDELNLVNKMDLGVAASTENLEETKLSEAKIKEERSEVQKSEKSEKNKKKNRKKKEKKKEKKESLNASGLDESRSNFHSLFKQEREMVKKEQLKEDLKENEPSQEGRRLYNMFYNNYYKLRNSKTPYQDDPYGFDKSIEEWKQTDEEVGELLYGYENEDYENDDTRRFICGFLKELAVKRGYSNIF